MRRSLVIWGLGQLTIGDRRGLLLLIAQPLAIIALLAVASFLIETTRWLLVLPALLLLLGVWLGQAISAYRMAAARGASTGGELQVALFLPLAVVVVTAFWLVGGTDGDSATTVRRYMSAWESNRPQDAVSLFAAPVSPADLGSQWALQTEYLERAVSAAAAEFPQLQSGIDPDEPFNSLLISELPSNDADSSSVKVEIVRRERVQTVLLGFIPTASQETVVVEQLGTITLRAQPVPPPSWLAGLSTGARVWRIDTVQLAAGPL